MRLGYLLPLSLATLSCAASEHIARRVATPIEENTDEAIRELQLSPSDRQAVFGDTGEPSAVHPIHVLKLKYLAIIKRLRVTDCHASISKQLEGRCKSEKDQIDPNEAFRSDRTSKPRVPKSTEEAEVKSPFPLPSVLSLPPCRQFHPIANLGIDPKLDVKVHPVGKYGVTLQRSSPNRLVQPVLG
jgi:hypothetical protein